MAARITNELLNERLKVLQKDFDSSQEEIREFMQGMNNKMNGFSGFGQWQEAMTKSVDRAFLRITVHDEVLNGKEGNVGIVGRLKSVEDWTGGVDRFRNLVAATLIVGAIVYAIYKMTGFMIPA